MLVLILWGKKSKSFDSLKIAYSDANHTIGSCGSTGVRPIWVECRRFRNHEFKLIIDRKVKKPPDVDSTCIRLTSQFAEVTTFSFV